jgi:hypothetical protein
MILGKTRPHREVWILVQQKSDEFVGSRFRINSACSGSIGFLLDGRQQKMSHIREDPAIENLQSARPAGLGERDYRCQFRAKLSGEWSVSNFIEAHKEDRPRKCVLVSGIFARRSFADRIRRFAPFGEFNGRLREQSFSHCSD